MRRMLAIALILVMVPALSLAQTLGEAMQRSYELESSARYGEALDALKAAPASDQSSYPVLLRQGWLLYLAGRYDAAISAYQKAVAAEPRAVEPRLGLLLPQMAALRWVDAERMVKEVLTLDPKSYLGMSRLAWIQYNLGRWADAERTYRAVLELYPADVEMRAGLGWSLLKQGKSGDASKAFRATLALAPNHTSAREGLATLGQTP